MGRRQSSHGSLGDKNSCEDGTGSAIRQRSDVVRERAILE